MPPHHLVNNFKVDAKDLDYLTNLLLEKETPLSSEELALALLERSLQEEAAALEKQYEGAVIYNPAERYAVGQRLIFSALDYKIGIVTGIRAGKNTQEGDFEVIAVEFDEHPTKKREFAAGLQTTTHPLMTTNGSAEQIVGQALSAREIFDSNPKEVLNTLEIQLKKNADLIRLAGKWFPRELIIPIEIGHLHLAEAVLDMNHGGPMTTEAILKEIGGLGSAPESLQIFSMNYTLNEDSRFSEVGPAGEVLWHLVRMMPKEVQNTPDLLRYNPIAYDPTLLTDEMRAQEIEINDELSDLEIDRSVDTATITLIYPHRRAGTLPLNAFTRQIFPTARTPRISIILVDHHDGETYPGWVVHEQNYVYGLDALYTKHRLPIGAKITVLRDERPGHIVVRFNSYRPRTEWIRLAYAKGTQLDFENNRRAIGAEYDELIMLGVDELAALDQLAHALRSQSITAILKMIIPSLGKLAPQGAAHVKTIYSAVNLIKRCPPGPILAILAANPDFENLGGDYWKVGE